MDQVQEVRGIPVRTLDILGEDFRSVDEVLINEIPSPDIVIVSKIRLLAEVPEILRTATIGSVSVLSQTLTLTEKSFIRFRISKTPTKVSGPLKLMQLFLKILFTTPGSDIFARKVGGAGLKSLGQTFTRDEGGDIISNLVISIDRTKRQIIQIQGRNSSLPPSERLLTASLVTSGFNKTATSLLAGIELIAQDGRPVRASLEL